MKLLIKHFVFLFLLLLPQLCLAYNFTPTQAEFNSWDARCKKAYSASSAGRQSGFFPKFGKEESAAVRLFGEQAGGAWHYCAGVIYLQRAMATTGQAREGNLKQAASEMEFTARNIPMENSWYPEIQIDLARVYFESGNIEKGFNKLESLLISHPNNSLSYTALAYYHKRHQRLDEAIKVLMSAPDTLLNGSAELNYFIGWYLMEAGKAENAVSYAQKAYQLNYPTPALRQRLAAKGYTW